jgi:regulatory protein
LDALQKKLMSKAGALLARRAHTRGELREKLLRFADEPEVEATLGRLEELNLLNDREYAYNFASRRSRHEGWGPLRVRQALLRRRVAPDLVEHALRRVMEEAGDTALREYVEKHCRKTGWPQDRRGIQRLIGHLRRRGFHEDSILNALRLLIPAAVWQRFDTGD